MRRTLLSKAAAALGRLMFPGSGGRYGMWPTLMPGSNFDYQTAAGDPTQNTIVMATLLWIMRAFPEAPPRVLITTQRGDEKQINHPVDKLLRSPNPSYSGLLLWQATVLSLNLSGNAYWIKLRDKLGVPQQLWYIPHHMIFPRWDTAGNDYVSYYEYRVNNTAIRFSPNDIIHFRNGLDPNNTRLGLSPLASALREIFTDNEGSNYSASVLRNFGVPGLIISSKDNDVKMDDPDHVKRLFMTKFSGDKRGEPLVLDGEVNVHTIQLSPEQMNLRELRRIPEERISALLGVPAMVAGLGAGLDRSTFTNMTEARLMAYHSNIIPTYRLLADELDRTLLAELGNPDDGERVEFDLQKVSILQEDQNNLWQRISTAYEAGWIMRSVALTKAGIPAKPEDDVYITDIKSADLQATAKIQATRQSHAPTDAPDK